MAVVIRKSELVSNNVLQIDSNSHNFFDFLKSVRARSMSQSWKVKDNVFKSRIERSNPPKVPGFIYESHMQPLPITCTNCLRAKVRLEMMHRKFSGEKMTRNVTFSSVEKNKLSFQVVLCPVNSL